MNSHLLVIGSGSAETERCLFGGKATVPAGTFVSRLEERAQAGEMTAVQGRLRSAVFAAL